MTARGKRTLAGGGTEYHNLLLRPVPEPSSTAALAGLAALGRSALLRRRGRGSRRNSSRRR